MWMESLFGFAGPPPSIPPLKGEGDDGVLNRASLPLEGRD